MPSSYWRKRWKAEHWIQLLYGRICDPSMARLGVARWISCLRDTRANLSASQDPERGRTILVTCGHTSEGSSGNVDRHSSSSKTWPAICRLEDTKSSETFKAWAIALRRASSLRRKSAHRTEENGSSSWPTVNAGNFNDGENGTTFTDAARGLWATTTTRDGKDGACSDAKVPTSALLGRQVLRTPWAGETTSNAGRVLNPRFCEALMGWPIGWTAYACAETESSPIKPPSHSENSPAIY